MRLSNYNWKDANLSQDPVPIENVNKILNIITKKHEYNVNNKGSWNNNLIISFSDPKIFNSMKFRIHEYSSGNSILSKNIPIPILLGR